MYLRRSQFFIIIEKKTNKSSSQVMFNGNLMLGNSRKCPYPTTDGFHVVTPLCLLKFQNALFMIMKPPFSSEILVFLEVHCRLSNGSMNKRTWIYASSRLWSSGARPQALLFSDKKNLPLVVRLCKLLFESEFGYKNKHHLRKFYSSLFSCVVLAFTKQNGSDLDC